MPAPAARSAPAAPSQVRSSRALGVALLAGLAAFGAQAFWVRRFFVSVPFWDEWADLFGFLAAYRAGFLDWPALVAQHMEHRIPVARLLFLLVYTIFGEGSLLGCLLLSALLAGTMIAIWAYTIRRLGEPVWLVAASVVVLASTCQFENMLWGFQGEFYTLVGAVVAAVCWIALAPRLTWPGVIGCAAACAVSTGSIASGLTSWAAVGLLLFLRAVVERRSVAGVLAARREWAQMFAFVAIGLAVSLAYLNGYQSVHPPDAAMRGPVELVRWSGFALVFPILDPLVPAQARWLPAVMAIVLGPIVLALWLYWRKGDDRRLLLMAGILLMVLGNVAILAFGRSGVVYVASRYGTICLWTSVLSLMAIAGLLREARGTVRRVARFVLLATAAFILGAHVARYFTFFDAMQDYQRVRRIFEHNVVTYLSDASPDRKLTAFLPFPEGPIRPMLDRPDFLAVLPYNLRPRARMTASGDAWSYEGTPAPVPPPPESFYWGSWSGEGAHQGELTSTAFQAPRPLVILLSGYPTHPGNSVAVESVTDPARRLLYTGADPGNHWIAWRIEREQLPGRRVRIVAVDGTAGPDGWLGVGVPMYKSRAVARLEAFVRHLELWVALAMLLPLVLIVAVPKRPDRQPPSW